MRIENLRKWIPRCFAFAGCVCVMLARAAETPMSPAPASSTQNVAKGRSVHFREPRSRDYILDEEISAKSALPKPWLRATRPGSTNHFQLGSRVVLKLQPGTKLDALLKD